MTGHPLSHREKQYIRTHAQTMSRGHIAQQLGILFPEDNDGYRSWRSVRSFISREQKHIETVIQISVPGAIINQLGVSIDDVKEIAKRAILDELNK